MPGCLYLIPNILSQGAGADSIASSVVRAIQGVRLFFVEEPKSARALLKKLDASFPLAECRYIDLNEHSLKSALQEAFASDAGSSWGLISEAGYPCVADPGAELVRLAHEKGMEIIPLAGASSIVLALAASGLGGQNFAFNGYLPKDKQERMAKIRALEQRCLHEGQTQVMMETPYRNQAFLEDLLSACRPQTLLCVAVDIMGESQKIKTAPISQWRKLPPSLPKKPALFLIGN